MHLVVILIIIIHLIITQTFQITIPIIPTVTIIVTMTIRRIKIIIIRWKIVILQIKHKRNTNSRVKHKTKKPKDNINSNNDSDNNDSDIDRIDTIDIERHLKESKDHLNKSGVIEFAKNACEFLLQQDWYSADNNGNTGLGSKKSSTISGVSDSIPEHSHEISQSDSFHKSVQGDQIFRDPHEISSNLNRGALPEPHKALENIRRKNINRLIFAQLNINSLRNKFESLQHIINKNIDVLFIFETKIDFCFPSAQFYNF